MSIPTTAGVLKGWIYLTRMYEEKERADAEAHYNAMIESGQFTRDNLAMVERGGRSWIVRKKTAAELMDKKPAWKLAYGLAHILQTRKLVDEFRLVAHPTACEVDIKNWLRSCPDLKGVAIPACLRYTRKALNCVGKHGGRRDLKKRRVA